MARIERVTRIIDGDTFETGSRKRPIRLANVNAPELHEPGGRAAKRNLEKLIGDKSVSVETVARDKYGRAVAKVKIGRESVNKKMNNQLK